MASPSLQPSRDGVEQRLDLILAELRAVRAALAPRPVAADDGQIELREPARRKGR